MQFLSQLDLSKVLFLDIETVPEHSNFGLLEPSWQKLWEKKAKSLTKDDITPSDLYDRAAIYAEFGKIVCIGVGIITGHPSQPKLRLKSFFGDDEKKY